MSNNVFTDVTSDSTSSVYHNVNGRLQVDISGTLGGADVIAYYKSNNGSPVLIRTCSWLSSLGDTLSVADGGYEFLNNRDVYFVVKNSTITTNINLDFDVE